MKREDYISWDEYFMGIAIFSAERSKDPTTQVGACIVSPDNRILSIGYNGAPRGLSDDTMEWNNEGKFLKVKNTYVCHSEFNAILNYRGNLEGAKIYVKLFPCNECAKAIIQSGIKEVIYKKEYLQNEKATAARIMFDACGVKYRQYISSNRKIEIEL